MISYYANCWMNLLNFLGLSGAKADNYKSCISRQELANKVLIPTSVCFQKSAFIQPRRSLPKFWRLFNSFFHSPPDPRVGEWRLAEGGRRTKRGRGDDIFLFYSPFSSS